MSLEIGPAMIGVKAAPAPVVVGVIGVRAKLEQDRRIAAGHGRPNDEEEVDLGGPPIAADELAAVVARPQPDIVVTAFPVSGNLERDTKPASRSHATSAFSGIGWEAPGRSVLLQITFGSPAPRRAISIAYRPAVVET